MARVFFATILAAGMAMAATAAGAQPCDGCLISIRMIQEPVAGGPPVPVDALVLNSQLEPVAGQKVFFDLYSQTAGTYLDAVFRTTGGSGWAQVHVVPGTNRDWHVTVSATILGGDNSFLGDSLLFSVNEPTPTPTATPTPFGTHTPTPVGTPTPIPAKLPSSGVFTHSLAFLLVGVMLVFLRRERIEAV